MVKLKLTSRSANSGKAKLRKSIIGFLSSTVTWILAIIFFFPVFWMVITSLKKEDQVVTIPPIFFFKPTLIQYKNLLGTISHFAVNSIIISVVSTLIVIVFALPAAYALSVRPVKKWQDGLFFFLSTKMLPVSASIAALFMLAMQLHLLDKIVVLILLYTVMNLPIAIWMLRSFLIEVPRDIFEAASIDGAGFFRTIRTVIVPMIAPGLGAVSLICFIFAWNEFFLAVNLTNNTAATLPVFLIGFITSEGSFWAQLSAAATVCAVPVVIAGWVAQGQLVRGLTLGAVK